MVPLFAQQMPMQNEMSGPLPEWMLVVPVAAVAFLLLVFFPILLLIRNGQIRREWEHAERMKSLEMGLPVAHRDAPWAKALVCVAIGAVVPLIAFGFTTLLFNSPQAANELWVAPAVVSVLSVIGASLLAGVLFSPESKSARHSDPEGTGARLASPGVKTSNDPDAFDVVGRRG